MLITTAADNILLLLFFVIRHFMWIFCLADDSHKMPNLFSLKNNIKKCRMLSDTILLSALRVKAQTYYTYVKGSNEQSISLKYFFLISQWKKLYYHPYHPTETSEHTFWSKIKRKMLIYFSKKIISLPKRDIQLIFYLISPWKHILWVLTRSVSMRHF